MSVNLYQYLTDTSNHLTLSQEAFLKYYKYTYLFICQNEPFTITYYGTNKLIEAVDSKYYVVNKGISYPGSELASKIIKKIEQCKSVGKGFYLPIIDRPQEDTTTIRHRVKGYKLISED